MYIQSKQIHGEAHEIAQKFTNSIGRAQIKVIPLLPKMMKLWRNETPRARRGVGSRRMLLQ